MTGWWFFTRSALESLTRPPADIEACDRAMVKLAGDSWMCRAADGLGRTVGDAWSASRIRRLAESVRRDLTRDTAASTLRVRGWVAVAAATTVLGLDAVKPVPVGPLSWLVPSIVIVAGLLTMLMAETLSRAGADRQARLQR